MNRREALKAAVVLTTNNQLRAKAFALKDSIKYVFFFDASMGDFGEKLIADIPNAVAYPVNVPKGKTLDDAVRVFETS